MTYRKPIHAGTRRALAVADEAMSYRREAAAVPASGPFKLERLCCVETLIERRNERDDAGFVQPEARLPR